MASVKGWNRVSSGVSAMSFLNRQLIDHEMPFVSKRLSMNLEEEINHMHFTSLGWCRVLAHSILAL